MIELLVNTDNEAVRELLKRLPEKLRAAAPSVLAESGAKLTREHLVGLASQRHRANMPRNYYVRAAQSVVAELTPDGAEIQIPHTGFALRYEGGTVYPSGRASKVTGRPIRKLSIPVEGSGAEGHTPGDFDNVFVIKGRRKGTAFLAGKKGNGMVGLLFALVAKTVHKPDASVLPTGERYQGAAEAALNEQIDEVTREDR